MGMFDGVETAKASFDAKYQGAGHYLNRIDRVKADKTRGGDEFLAVEMTVLHTFADGQGDPAKWHKPGEAVSHLMMKKHDSFLGNVKAMVANVMGAHESEVTKADCERICTAEQPFAGMVVELSGRDILTKKNQPFTKISYVREMPAVDLPEILDEKIIATYFPGDTLADMIAEQSAEEGG